MGTITKENQNHQIWKHYDGYYESRLKVLDQSTEKDLESLDELFGRRFLPPNPTPEEIKREVLRQHEIDWRDHKRSWWEE